MPEKLKILIAPLDWGLGHATRCIPIIKKLLDHKCEIFIAAEGAIKILLQTEFKKATFLSLSGYNVKYSQQKKWLSVKIIIQTPSILYSIYKEHKWLKKVVKTYNINAIISDNRFGMYNTTIPCIYITHQLVIKTGNKFTEKILNKFHFWFIKKYSQYWIPDFATALNLAGELSHPENTLNAIYIGALSRFKKNNNVETKYDLLILLSGPEPQRTILEKLLLLQINDFSGTVLIVRGTPVLKKVISTTTLNGRAVIKNHLKAEELNKAILQSKMIICRSGYTTIMDLIKLQKKAILIPTPGQTEQEYLAAYLMKQNLFYSVQQEDFLLEHVLEKAADFKFKDYDYNMEQFEKPISEFIESIKKHNRNCYTTPG